MIALKYCVLYSITDIKTTVGSIDTNVKRKKKSNSRLMSIRASNHE